MEQLLGPEATKVSGRGKLVNRHEKEHTMKAFICFIRRLQYLEFLLSPKKLILSKISSRVKEHIYHHVIQIGFRSRAPLNENQE
jgi:hypothetical protein